MPRPRNDRPGEQLSKELFYFHRYDPGSGAVGGWKLQFEAHITNISDGSSPNWNESYDMGRADPTMFYGGMNRTINVSFQVIAMNKEEHINNHEELLAKLGKMTYPKYNSGLGYNGSHCYFQIGQLYKLFGVLTSVNYAWDGNAVWIENRPIYTDISISLRVLADSEGNRPNINKRYFN